MKQKIEAYLNELLQLKQKYETAIAQFNQDIEVLTQRRTTKLADLASDYNKEHVKVLEKLDYLNAEIFRYGELLKKEFKVGDLSGVMKERFVELKEAVEDYVSLKSNAHQTAHDKELAEITEKFTVKENELGQKKELYIEEVEAKLEQLLSQLQQFLTEHIESKKNTCSPANLHLFSEASFDHTSDELTLGQRNVRFEGLPGDKSIAIPQLSSFKDAVNLVVYYNKETAAVAENISDVLMLRMLLSHLPDKLKVHIYDKNMNEKFREFLSIPEKVLSRGFDWAQFTQHLNQCESEIRSKLGRVWADITSDHQTLHQYNVKLVGEEKYDDIVAYFLFVFDDFLSFLNPHEYLNTLQRLDQLLNYGSNALLMVKVDDDFHKDKLPALASRLQNMRFQAIDLTGTMAGVQPMSDGVIFENISLEHKKIIIENFLSSLHNLDATRAKLKFNAYAVAATETWFASKAASEVKVPIGKSQQTAGFEYLSFKTKDMLSNALLCGGVGSGKTNFLKGVITSMALNYSPNDLEMWLIDMKNGAGFSIFNNMKLPHATKYAFSAESELINDIFFQLKREMEERYTYFAQFSVDNLDDASKLTDVDPSKLKRIVLIIDEFATIFSEDDPYIDEIGSNLLSIIQKGRAMGINMLLAAQNFNNIRNSSFAQAVTLIPTRLLLKSSPEAALSVLGSGNNGSVEITRIGEGLINTNYGELNSGGGNNYFKSFLLDNDDLKPLLESIGTEIDARKLTRPFVKFIDAAQPAVFAKNYQLFTKLATPNYTTTFAKNGIDCYMGETYLISNDAHFSFPWKINGRQVAQNILITGNEREHSIQALFSTLSSLSYGIPEAKFRVNFLNALDADFSSDLGLDALASAYSQYDFETYEESQLEQLLHQLTYLLEQRRHSTERSPIITYLVGFEKLVKLHKSDYVDAQLSEQLKNLMSTGSSYGLYFVLEINKPSNLDKVSRDLLGFIEHRICFALNVDESTYLLASKAATKLIDLDAPNIRNKAIYYALSDGEISKFKSYSALEQDVTFVRELNNKVASTIDLTNIHLSSAQVAASTENEALNQDAMHYSDDDKALLSNLTVDDL
jgi:hypothetical protein